MLNPEQPYIGDTPEHESEEKEENMREKFVEEREEKSSVEDESETAPEDLESLRNEIYEGRDTLSKEIDDAGINKIDVESWSRYNNVAQQLLYAIRNLNIAEGDSQEKEALKERIEELKEKAEEAESHVREETGLQAKRSEGGVEKEALQEASLESLENFKDSLQKAQSIEEVLEAYDALDGVIGSLKQSPEEQKQIVEEINERYRQLTRNGDVRSRVFEALANNEQESLEEVFTMLDTAKGPVGSQQEITAGQQKQVIEEIRGLRQTLSQVGDARARDTVFQLLAERAVARKKAA